MSYYRLSRDVTREGRRDVFLTVDDLEDPVVEPVTFWLPDPGRRVLDPHFGRPARLARLEWRGQQLFGYVHYLPPGGEPVVVWGVSGEPPSGRPCPED